jgi:hypothetical protein
VIDRVVTPDVDFVCSSGFAIGTGGKGSIPQLVYDEDTGSYRSTPMVWGRVRPLYWRGSNRISIWPLRTSVMPIHMTWGWTYRAMGVWNSRRCSITAPDTIRSDRLEVDRASCRAVLDVPN